MAIVLVSHDLGVIAQTCDRVAVMYAGYVVEEAATTDAVRDAAAPVHAPRCSTPCPSSRQQRGDRRLVADHGPAARPRRPAARLPVRPALRARATACAEVSMELMPVGRSAR